MGDILKGHLYTHVFLCISLVINVNTIGGILENIIEAASFFFKFKDHSRIMNIYPFGSIFVQVWQSYNDYKCYDNSNGIFVLLQVLFAALFCHTSIILN